MKTPRQINAERKKEGLPPLNFKLFRAVIKKLRTAPTAYEQRWALGSDNQSPCGTIACIGGWADILSATDETERVRRLRGDIHLDRAADALGLNGERWAGELRTERTVLFDGRPQGIWPAPFSTQFDAADGREERAQVAIRYLNHIIETGKVLE